MGGSAKPLLDTGTGTFLERVVHALREGGAMSLVVGVREDPGPLAAHARELGATVVVPSDVDDGPISTLRTVLDGSCLEARPDVVLFLPADMPLVRPATVSLLVEGWREAAQGGARPPTVALPSWQGTTGHPALFAGPALEDLLDPDLPQGARSVVDRHRQEGTVLEVPVEDRGITVDIDTVPDYRRHFPRAFRKRFQKW